MSWLAVWFVGVGLADLVRATGRPALQRAAPWIGAVAVLVVGLLAGLTTAADLVVLALSTVPLLLWVRFSTRSLREGGGHVAALLSLATGVAGLLALSGWASPVGGPFADWLVWADVPLVDGHGAERVLLVVGLVLLNLSTANVIVRLVLVSVGALRPTRVDAPGEEPADRLRGGRLLGPMERLFLLGLGLAGQLTAAAVVIAAKGLLRFPELQSRKDWSTSVTGVGIDEVTEYFLVGSFVSWLVALVSVAVVR